MTLKTTKRLLTLASVTIVCAAAGILFWGLAASERTEVEDNISHAPVRAAKAGNQPTKERTSRTAYLVSANPSRSNFEAVWERPLRRPLFDPPPPPAKVVEKAPPAPVRAKLLATMVESENSTAVLRLASGAVVFRKVGESLGADEPDVKVAKIEPGAVSVRRGDGETRLLVDGAKSR